MSYFSIGRNEVQNLVNKKRELLEKIDSVKNTRSGNVQDFRTILLEKEVKNITNRLEVLRFLSPAHDDNQNNPA